MAKGKKKTSRWWIIALFVVGMLVLIYGTSKNNKPQQKESSTAYVIYQSPTYKFSIAYPQAWEVKNDTQVFENGDAIAFRKKGPTQKEQTELTDGAQVAVSKPFSITTDLASWTKEYFSNQAEFSQMTVNDRVFEKINNCSSIGCMTYLYTLVNDQVYGVAVFAEGLDKDKMVYENATLYMLKSLRFTSSTVSTVSKEQAVAKVSALPEVIDYLKRVPNGLVSVNGEENDIYMIQVYEIKNGHTATFNWYNVNKATGAVEKQF